MKVPAKRGTKLAKKSMRNAANHVRCVDHALCEHGRFNTWVQGHLAGFRNRGTLAEDRLLRGLASIKRPEANRSVYPLFPLSVKELLEL
jgi:hypothetical protein